MCQLGGLGYSTLAQDGASSLKKQNNFVIGHARTGAGNLLKEFFFFFFFFGCYTLLLHLLLSIYAILHTGRIVKP